MKRQYVNVINSTMSGTYILEGRARVVQWLEDGQALVQFGEPGESCVYRFIDPKAQVGNVGRYIVDLNAGDVEVDYA